MKFKMKLSWSQLLFIITLIHSALAEDFYQLLGVTKQSSAKEIRKAFKKLALKMHPDKNIEDPDAHDKFLRINRAYEVLKDEDLRKKYDMYGEDGLKEDGPSGRGYKSWNFYNQDFGIYDDDPEIITLSKQDFEQSVENTDDIWFVNYYSPQCSHCHELAPTWREIARELEGVVRIGAVNCGDEWMLCRQQGIRSYPSLLMYPQKEKYYGDRTRKELVNYVLRQVRAPVIELWSANFDSEINDEEKKDLPWLISFCGDGGDCLESRTTVKLAAMLADLTNVGSIDCHVSAKICENLGVESGTFFYEAEQIKKGRGVVIDSLDAREVAFAVLGLLPEVQVLSPEDFNKVRADLKTSSEKPWLIHFVEGEVVDLELRKLPAMLSDVQVGRVDCTTMRSDCNDLHIHKFPTFVMFKPGGSHEIHHGRLTAHDIAAFAQDSALTKVEVLGPQDFPQRVVDERDPWFVDFYAPWCPPCMRLLPEFRKASKHIGDRINFGTVDCTIHQGLCSKYGVRSYPTTIFFNESVPHRYHGHHNSHNMIEFLEDTLKPPVIILDENSFPDKISKKAVDEIWLVDFFAPWCGPCQQLAPEWRKLAKTVANMDKIKVAQVDCDANRNLCSQQNVRGYPTIRLYPTRSTNANNFHVYNGWFRDAQNIRAWAFEYLPSDVHNLNWQMFHSEVLGGEDPWIVDFFTPWCGHCQVFAPEYERVAQTMKGQVHAGKVDCDRNQQLCQSAGIRAYPTVRFYQGRKGSSKQSVYGEDIDSQNANHIIAMLRGRVGNKKVKIVHDEF